MRSTNPKKRYVSVVGKFQYTLQHLQILHYIYMHFFTLLPLGIFIKLLANTKQLLQSALWQ